MGSNSEGQSEPNTEPPIRTEVELAAELGVSVDSYRAAQGLVTALESWVGPAPASKEAQREVLVGKLAMIEDQLKKEFPDNEREKHPPTSELKSALDAADLLVKEFTPKQN